MKIFLTRGYIPFISFDVLCLSQTFLDSSTLSDNSNLEIPEYTLIRAEHPSNW